MNQRSKPTSPRRGEDGALSAPGEHHQPGPLPTTESRKWKRLALYALVGVLGVACVATGAVWGLVDSFGAAPFGRDLELSKTVLDRNGRLLRSYVTSQGRWRLPATREQVDPRYLA